MPAFEPAQFGRYLLTERIAVGGMAEIFIAKIFGAMGFEKQVVIKRILPQFAQDDEFLRMFVTEAKLVCHLEHPNIVQVFELGEQNGQYYIAMEYVNGLDARQMWRTLAKRKQRLPGVLALFLVSEMLKGLDYAHRAVGPDKQVLGVVHRDVSPSNVMVSYRGDVKIGDFGIALVEQETRTQAGVLKGKYGYMSPEQVAGLTVDHRSDIFAAGIVLAELLLGRRLFLGRSDFETLDKVLNVRLDALEQHASALPDEAVRIVRRALQREPDDRYASARDFHDDIMDFLFAQRHRVTSETLATFIAQHIAPFVSSTPGGDASEDGRSPPTPVVPDGIVPSDLRERRRPSALYSRQREELIEDEVAVRTDAVTADTTRPVTATDEEVGELDLSGEEEDVVYEAAVETMDADFDAAPVLVGTSPAPGFDPDSVGQELDLSDADEELFDGNVDSDANPAASSGLATREAMFTAQLDPVAPSIESNLAGQQRPDFAGSLSNRTAIKVLFRFSLVSETGLLTLTGPTKDDSRLADLIEWVRGVRRIGGERAGQRTCEIHLQEGQPHLVAADRSEEDLVAYLIRTDELQQHKVERGLKNFPQRSTMAALLQEGLIAPLQISRYLTSYVLDAVTESFSWTEGDFAFYRGRDCSTEAFPTGLDALELIWRGAATLPESMLSIYFSLLEGQPLRVNQASPIGIEAFPQDEVLQGAFTGVQQSNLSADRLIGSLAAEPLAVMRALYALIECEMVMA